MRIDHAFATHHNFFILTNAFNVPSWVKITFNFKERSFCLRWRVQLLDSIHITLLQSSLLLGQITVSTGYLRE